jgi:hypothetical protein
MMQWTKLGLIPRPKILGSWAKTHCMIPTPMQLPNGLIRIFTTFCDENGVGRPGYIDVNEDNPLEVVGFSKDPLLDVGVPGSFDESGILACSVVRNPDGSLNLYYVGFELGQKIRYRLLTGLAQSFDGGSSFVRYSRSPILERSDNELYFRGGPYCIFENGKYRMWYVAGSEWEVINGKAMPVYEIYYAESNDGKKWPSSGKKIIPISKNDEHGFGRPYIFNTESGNYSMYYSIRRKSLQAYRLGYAESLDGKKWNRLDKEVNLDVTPDSYDSEAIMYAAPFRVGKNVYLFYNGNNFGRSGIAVAKLTGV